MASKNQQLQLKKLQEHLSPYGHSPSKYTLGLQNYNTVKTIFTLAFEAFGVKYLNKRNTDHLVKGLKEKYQDTEVNWEGDKLCSINFKWDCTKRECQLNVLAHMNELQQRHKHQKPSKL